MSQATLPALFPLPLTIFERYLFLDTRPGYSMTVPMQFDFRGSMDRGAFEAALDEALARHPLLCARVEPVGRRGLCFVPAEERPPLDWQGAEVPLGFPSSEFLDLTREPGVRFWIREGNGRATLTLQFHHACCDGMGSFHFLGDLFAAYGQRTAAEGQRPKMAPLAPEYLRTRGQFLFTPPEPIGLPRIVWSTVYETTKWALRRPEPLAVPSGTNGVAASGAYPGLAVHQFDVAQSRALRQRASRSGVTVNDLLLRDLFLAMAQWNDEHRAGRPGRWLALNMPQNLRERGCEAMPAANKMSYVFLTRQTRELTEPEALLRGLHAETELIKQWSAGLFFISGLEWTLKVPGLCRSVLAGNRCYATAVLSNLGDFGRRLPGTFPREEGRLVVGNLRLEGCRMAPPPRPLTRVALAVFTYANQLNVNLLGSPDFSRSAGEELLRAFVTRLEQSAAENLG